MKNVSHIKNMIRALETKSMPHEAYLNLRVKLSLVDVQDYAQAHITMGNTHTFSVRRNNGGSIRKL